MLMRVLPFILLLSFNAYLTATNATWIHNANSTWNTNANWSPATFPNAIDDTANFLNAITANRVVTLGIPITVGTINFDDNNNYNITANTLTLQTSVGNASVSVTNVNGNGADTISSAVSLASNLTMSLGSSTIANFTMSGAISGVGTGITKTGTGTGSLVLSSGSNSYTGATNINQGNLTYNTNGCIPAASTVTIGDGVTANVNLVIAAAMTAINALNVTINSDGTLMQNSNQGVQLASLQGSGNIIISGAGAASNLFNISGSTSTTFSGSIAGGVASASTNPTTANRLTKGGASTLTLSGNSTYVSRTFIEGGVIDVQSANSLGASGASSAVYVFGTTGTGSLYIENSINLPKTVFLNGAGVSGFGSLQNKSGSNTISGNVTIGWAGGGETAADVTIQVNPATSLTISSIISGSNNLTFTDTGTNTGTLTYTGALANTLSGLTTISSGILSLNKTPGVNAIAANAQVNGGTLLLSATNQIADTSIITLAGGAFNMNGNTETIGSLIFNSGTLTQGGATLSLANATATALTMSDGTSIPGNIAFTAAGGVTYTGTTNTATISGNIDLGTFAHTFNINNGAANPDMNISGVISDTGTVTMSTSTGILQFSGTSANLYSGLTTLNAGTLTLNKTLGVNAIAGNVTINAGGTLLLATSEQIADTSTVTISGGTFNMATNSETIGSLIFSSGTLTQGAGSLLTLSSNATALTMTGTTIAGNIALSGTGGVTTNASATVALISGNMDLGSSIHTFTIANGAATPDLNITGVISGTGGITKVTGASTLSFSGTSANTYSGLTTVTAGTLNLNGTADVNAIAGNVLINGGTLLLSASEQIIDTATVTLSSGTFNMNGNAETIGTLIFDGGTLTQGGATLSLSSNINALTMRNTTISGAISLTGTGGVVFDATSNGTATISGTIDLGGFVQTFNIANGTAANDMTISGSISDGGVTTIGAGRLQFSGGTANTYTGLTTVSAGELFLNKTAGVTSIAGDVLINGGQLTLNNSNQIINTSNMTLQSGTFSMAGNSDTINSLLFTGGTLTLTGGGTLSLASNITALTMRNTAISAGTVSLTGTGEVIFDATNNGTATLNSVNLNALVHIFDIAAGTASTDMLISGVISGVGGGITKIGAGLLEFEGGAANTYTGLTTVTSGDLLLAKTAGNAIAGNVLINGGNLILGLANKIANTSTITLSSGTFNMSGFAETIATLIFDGGTLTQGGATLTFAGAVTALSMQNTTINGNIALTGGGSILFDNTNNGTATINGNINLGGVPITFNVSDGTAAIDMLISGIISNGSLIKAGLGTLVLTGANTYAAGTTVNAGTLQGDATSLQGNITNNANLVFNETGTGTYAGSITGPGTVVSQGTGTLTLSGINTIGGLASVNAGTLIVNNTLTGAGNLNVAAGAVLRGVGPIDKNMILTGTLIPGDIGTIAFTGTQVFASGSSLEIELTPTTNDLVDITGTLTIQPGTNLNILPDPGNYTVPFSYLIVQTTGGVTGTFSSVTSTLPLFQGSVTYFPLGAPTDIFLEVLFLPFSNLITKGNAAAVAHCLDILPAPAGSDLSTVIASLHMLPTTEELKKALLQLQPSAFTSLAIAQEDNTLYVRNALFNRLETIALACKQDEKKKMTLWTTGFGGYTSQHNLHSEPGFKSSTPGLFMGFDGSVFSHGYIGGGVGYSFSDLHWREHRGNAKIQSIYGAVYGRWATSRWYIHSSLIGGYNFYKIDRRIKFGEGIMQLSRHARSHHSGIEYSADLKAALQFDYRGVVYSPFASMDYLFLHEYSFREHGANSLNLKVKDKNSDLLVSEGGLEISRCFIFKRKNFNTFLQLSAIRESRFEGKHEKASFTEGCLMNVTGIYPSRTLGGLSAGINGIISKHLSFISLLYKGKYGQKFQDHSLYLQFLINF